MNTGPFRKTPAATMKVAPVSESDLAKASVNAAINEGFMIGKVTVLEAVNGGAPRFLMHVHTPSCNLARRPQLLEQPLEMKK